MDDEKRIPWITHDDPLVISVVEAIHTGDVPSLKRLLAENPGLAVSRIAGSGGDGTGDGKSRTLLHVATDWPGHFPNNAAVVTALIEAGAGVNARINGPHSETPLHWAASCDDVEVLDLLLDSGADIEASGAVRWYTTGRRRSVRAVAGGTPAGCAWSEARALACGCTGPA